MRQIRDFILHGLPPLLWLVLVWCALWQDFSVPNVAFGLLLSILVTYVFRMPRLYLSDRFNLWHSLKFLAYFLWGVAVASYQLAKLSFAFGKPINSAMVAVELRTRSDLFITATSHALSLIPGSLVVDVDRAHSILYLHVIDVDTPEGVEEYRVSAQKIEAMILRAAGHSDEYEALLREDVETDEDYARTVAAAERGEHELHEQDERKTVVNEIGGHDS